jgi:hypothetical protein
VLRSIGEFKNVEFYTHYGAVKENPERTIMLNLSTKKSVEKLRLFTAMFKRLKRKKTEKNTREAYKN